MTTVEQAFELFSAQEPKGWRVELVEGEICVSSVNDGEHAEIVAELRDQATDPDRRISCYTGIGLKVPGGTGDTGATGEQAGRARQADPTGQVRLTVRPRAVSCRTSRSPARAASGTNWCGRTPPPSSSSPR
ncbi:hypothetical protein ACPB9E_33850 [Streptomyces exfoliatus]|uniref:hypothetical protein n=1 Tax=Streptomyces exfoliatus TaxID=1905 RepID=UPI003C2F5546